MILILIFILNFLNLCFAETDIRPVAHWNFDEGNAKDISGNELHGSIRGAIKWVDGHSGKALYFDGATNYMTVNYNALLDKGPGQDFSISFLFKPDLVHPQRFIMPLFSKSGGSSTLSDYIIFFEHWDETPNLIWGTGDAKDKEAWQRTDIPSRGEWHHVFATIKRIEKNGQNFYEKQFYIDCTLKNQGVSYIRAQKQNNPLHIGALFSRKTMRFEYYKGAMDEIQFYDKIVSLSDVNNNCKQAPIKPSGTCAGVVCRI